MNVYDFGQGKVRELSYCCSMAEEKFLGTNEIYLFRTHLFNAVTIHDENIAMEEVLLHLSGLHPFSPSCFALTLCEQREKNTIPSTTTTSEENKISKKKLERAGRSQQEDNTRARQYPHQPV